ncbi:hypothetical protein V6N13_125177 [Hibiscus sabdariffa]|uniref:Uncharacterized protein n=1 Tax=Hibiscus sabdariffa TaxID=183260 RepID=A0ABR2U4X9_9ROSI
MLGGYFKMMSRGNYDTLRSQEHCCGMGANCVVWMEANYSNYLDFSKPGYAAGGVTDQMDIELPSTRARVHMRRLLVRVVEGIEVRETRVQPIGLGDCTRRDEEA